ncbi:MAG: Gfo/Idh/MocA family oxidoreductase [Planctomycetota bacterium]
MRLGVIGADSSHLPEFSRRIKEMHDEGRTPCRVTHVFDPGDHDWPNPDDVQKWKNDAAELGVEPVGTMDDLLAAVDGVLVLAVNGNKHLGLSESSLATGKPTYVDKPLTCSTEEAKTLLARARSGNARCYSASSLRFATELERIPRDELGPIVAIDAFGPGELNPSMPGLFHYGCHTIEMVDAIWGPGVNRVSALETTDRHLLDMEYGDGRFARLRLDRRAGYEFGATVHGEKGVHQFRVDFGPVYTRLVEGMVRFFEGGTAPAELRDIVENVAVMEAGNASAASQGDWMSVPEIV